MFSTQRGCAGSLPTFRRRSLDDVTQGLMRLDKVSTKDFVAISENVLGGKSRVLDTRLLR